MKRMISLLLTMLLLVGLLSGLTVGASAATLTERQQALVAVAQAYYDKGHWVQYDGDTINDAIDRSDYGKTRSTYEVPPEYATPHERMFTVCSDFAYQVYYEAFRYKLLGNEGVVWTGSLVDIPKDDPIVVWTYAKDSKDDPKAEVEKMFRLAQVGDIFTSRGHTMVWVGDVDGDGKPDLLHSGGSHMKRKASQTDVREYKTKEDTEFDPRFGSKTMAASNGGSILLNDAVDYITNNYSKKAAMSLVRPLNVINDNDNPITPATKYRVSHPRLSINRYLNKTRFNSAFSGETVTMTLALSNSSKTDYTVPVTEKTPAGAKLKTPFTGANVSGETQTLNVELKAGETKTLTAEYEITAKRGEQVVFDGGSVGDIPSNSIPIQVGGAKLTADEQAKLAAIANGDYNSALKEGKARNDTMGDVVYQKILGLNVKIPDAKTVMTKFVKSATTPSDKKTNVFLKKDEVASADLTEYSMLVPTCWGGNSMWNRFGIDRCSEPRDMHVEPGDVIVRSPSLTVPSRSEMLVYLGGGKYLSYDPSKGTYPIEEEPKFFMCLDSQIFYVLRPTLAYDDLHTLPALPAAGQKLKFTDVKESDWFYTYVKDLVDDGTVNGMTATTFVPNGTLTFGQALKLICLAVGETEPAKDGQHWASGWLKLAKSKGWIGEEPGLDATITRLQLCRIAAKAKGLNAAPEKNPFTDTYDADVLALYKAGVINGMTATEFKPEGLLTRAQIAKIIWTLRKV